MKRSKSLFMDALKIGVVLILVGILLTACFTEAEKASNEGIRKSQEGLYGEAIEEFNRSIELDPNNPIPYYMRGYVYARLAMYREAILDFNKAIELDPDDSDAFYNRGNMYRQLGKNESAIADYTRAIELNSANSSYFHNRGLLLGEMGRINESIKDLREACRLGNEDSCIALEIEVEKKKNK